MDAWADSISLVIHVLAVSVLVGGQVLLFMAVVPATWLIDDERLRHAVTRVVTRRFAWLTGLALVALLVTGLYQFYSVVPEPVRESMNDYRFGPVFMIKMTAVVVLVALIGVHAMYFGPRIARASDAAVGGDEEAVFRVEDLRRTSLLLSLAMLLLSVAVLGMGVLLGYQDYSYLPR